MGGIFICYRREDGQHAAGRLSDALQRHFDADQIFLDVDNIEPGMSFVEVIKERLAASSAMVVMIGPHWNPQKTAEITGLTRRKMSYGSKSKQDKKGESESFPRCWMAQ